MVETKDVVIATLGATTASSALVLVFISVVAQILWSTKPSNQRRKQFKIAGGVSALAFFIGLLCAGLSTWWLTLHQPGDVYAALVAAFLLQLVLLGFAGVLVFYQTIFT
jgi:hypothetical protein